MGETEINLIVVVDVPVQTAHDLVRRGFQRVSLITVSYTHLDVYKRQILCRMMCITALLRSLEIPSLAVPDPTINPENLKDGIITRHNQIGRAHV